MFIVRFLLLTERINNDFKITFFSVTTKLNSASNRQSPAESSPTSSPASPPEDNSNKQPTTA